MNVVVRKYNEKDYNDVDRLLFDIFGYHKENKNDSRV